MRSGRKWTKLWPNRMLIVSCVKPSMIRDTFTALTWSLWIIMTSRTLFMLMTKQSNLCPLRGDCATNFVYFKCYYKYRIKLHLMSSTWPLGSPLPVTIWYYFVCGHAEKSTRKALKQVRISPIHTVSSKVKHISVQHSSFFPQDYQSLILYL